MWFISPINLNLKSKSSQEGYELLWVAWERGGKVQVPNLFDYNFKIVQICQIVVV